MSFSFGFGNNGIEESEDGVGDTVAEPEIQRPSEALPPKHHDLKSLVRSLTLSSRDHP